MKQVWVFPLNEVFAQRGVWCKVKTPRGGRVVHCDSRQCGSEFMPHVWIEVNPEAEMYNRSFAIVKTGEDIPTGFLSINYVGTVHLKHRDFHIYEGTN